MIIINKVSLITGAGSGIGKAFAVCLAQQGYDLIIVGRNQEKLIRVQEELVKEFQIECSYICADLNAIDDVEKISEYVYRKYNRLDLLINNAAVAKFGSIETFSFEDINEQFSINVVAPITLVEKLLPLLKESKEAHIINISSDVSFNAVENCLVYGATKSAINYITKSFAKEFLKYGIRVNAIAPGPVNTELLKNSLSGAEVTTPMGRILEPKEISNVLKFLLGAEMITGTIIDINGGTIL